MPVLDCAGPGASQNTRVIPHDAALGIRWSVGDVSDDGFEALQLSVWGARKVFGDRASYVICFDTLALADVRARTGVLPDGVRWQSVQRVLPDFLKDRIGTDPAAREVGGKLLPLRVFPDRFELSFDNDCILWDLPVAIATWLEDHHPTRCLLVEDVRLCSGRFAAEHPEPRSTCIRGLPPGFDLGAALAAELARTPGVLASEQDELGLQVAALSSHESPAIVPVADVTICSPFPPHHLARGRCGAHFVGIDTKTPAPAEGIVHDAAEIEQLREHWRHHRMRLFELVGLVPPVGHHGPTTADPSVRA